MRWLCYSLVVLLAAVSGSEEPLPWWKTAVFYQVFPRSFKDSDGDGIGDIKGIIDKADHFKEIGVDAIWLSPIYTSPMVDFGYDISNYTEIDPLFGTMADFDALMAKMKKIDVKLVLDIVPNHTSDEISWFKKSINAKEFPEFKDFYVWKDPQYDSEGERQPPNNWLSVFGGSAWEWNEERQQYYLHQFTKDQPDLNYEDPKVWKEMNAVLRFWLDKGIDGFRVDAVKFIYDDKEFRDDPVIPGAPPHTFDSLQHIYEQNQQGNFKLMEHWAEVVLQYIRKDGRPRAMFLEVYDEVEVLMSYYGTGEHSFVIPFNFKLIEDIDQNVRAPDIKRVIDTWMSHMPKGGVASWVVSNHDKPRVPDRYGSEIVDGITLLTGVLPGVKCVYYGEEIGMKNTFIRFEENTDPRGIIVGPYKYLEETRDPARSPMQWDNTDPSAGFSTNSNTWLPINPNYWWLNVKDQRKAPTSYLKVFKALSVARKDPVLQRGSLKVHVPEKDTLIIVREYKGSYFVLIINTGSILQTYTSQNVFASLEIDMDMTIVISSVNSDYDPGFNVKKGKIALRVGPKAAILLRSGSTTNPVLKKLALFVGLSVIFSAISVFFL